MTIPGPAGSPNYLDLMDRIVGRQIAEIKTEPFEAGSRITRYFELLPENALKRQYDEMIGESDPARKADLQVELRAQVVPGSIDANIMTKVNRTNYRRGQALPPEYADSLAALRGFALSGLRSSIVFSAGLNQKLCTYMSSFEDFYPDENGALKKQVVLKVSDYRSAEIQGRFLAKRGIWISEFRIESGLNCGGHAFPTNGNVMGPILEQFKERKQELISELFEVYSKALAADSRPELESPPQVKFTAQGGIGTHAELQMMLEYYEMNATGWGTPFLLVPEVTSVDQKHLEKMASATEDDVFLSKASPLSIPFWNLKGSDSEKERQRLIEQGTPGSNCPKGYAVTNTEFSEQPICIASRLYQKLKLASLSKNGYSEPQMEMLRDDVLSKACVCHDLSGSIKLKNGIERDALPAICSGPNIAYFSKVSTLEQMVDHIYGRGERLCRMDRPHVFIQEMRLYVEYLKRELERFALELSSRKDSYFHEFKQNLLEGLDYYHSRAEKIVREDLGRFLDDLKALYNAVESLEVSPAVS